MPTGALDWDGEIENEGQEYKLLPEGDYYFRVAEVKKEWNTNKNCYQAKCKLEVVGGEDKALIFENLNCHADSEWRLCQFYWGIGMRAKGERLKMNWRAVPGKWGFAHVVQDTYNGKTSNKIKYYMEQPAGTPPDWCLAGGKYIEGQQEHERPGAAPAANTTAAPAAATSEAPW